MNLREKIMETMLQLVEVPGISGTESENLTAKKICEIIADIPYFKIHKEHFGMTEIEGDPLNRKFVWALYKGNSNQEKTFIITGHFDVVGVEEFGHLKDLAFNPVEYTRRVRELGLSDDALKDLESGDWIFGRGTADMKYGLALHLELLKKYSEEDFQGNILLLAVPGEESNSEGMLGAVPFLCNIRNKYGLAYEALLNSECCFPEYAGDDAKKVYLGSCGKVMPLFFFAGKESHVCESLTSLNSNLMASELTKLMEVNIEFCEIVEESITPPPICLKLTDLKELYSVQTPMFSAAYYNLQTISWPAEKLMEKLLSVARESFINSIEAVNSNIEKYSRKFGVELNILSMEPAVLTFEDLYAKVKEVHGEAVDIHIKEKINFWTKEKKDIQTIAVNIVKEVYNFYPQKRPMIIVGFVPPYYPYKHLDKKSKDTALREAIEDMCRFSKEEQGIELFTREYFMGISDLSYTGLNSEQKADRILSNLVGLDYNYFLPFKELRELDIPSVIIGGFGKDYHKYTERLNISYSFDIVPELYDYIFRRLIP